MKVKQETAGKIGLFSAIMIIFGAVVGIGIFFKNGGVFNNNINNSWGVLISWIIAIVLVLCMALSFAEIATVKTKSQNAGLGGWAESLGGKKFGRAIKLAQPIGYYQIQIFAVMFFAGEALLNCIKPGELDFGRNTVLYILLAGGGLFALFLFLNYVIPQICQKFGTYTSIIKFVPLVSVIILGIIFGILSNGGGLWAGHAFDGTKVSKDINITGIIMSLPGILFAFEGYLVIGNVAGEVKNKEKNVPLAMLFGIIIISIFNLLITIGMITAGTGNPYALMKVVFGENKELVQIFSVIISIFIFITIIGVLNAMVYGGMRSLQSSADEGLIFKSQWLKNKNPNKPMFAGMIYSCVTAFVLFLGTAIPSIILNNDQIIDGASNVNVVFFYLVYGTIVFLGLLNRKTKKVEVIKNKAFPVVAVVGTFACLFVFCFCSFYQFLIGPILDANGTDYARGWGLFVPQIGPSYFMFTNWQVSIVFWVVGALIVSIPFINDLLIKLFDKSYGEPLLWQKDDGQVQINQLARH